MKRVIILTHGFLHDRRNGVTFHEAIVFNPDPEAKKGSKVRLGVAEDVDPAIVREYFLGHENYIIEGYTDQELGLEAEDPQEAPEGTKGTTDAVLTVPDPKEDPEREANPLAGVDFNNDNASEMAAELGLTAADFKGIAATGKGGGYLTKDVRLANKKRQA